MNIVTIICVVSVVLFSANSIVATYKNLIEVNRNLEREYNEILDKYKKIIAFTLKNNLPQNINYFNSAVSVTYNIPAVREFKIGKPKDIITSSNDNKVSNNNKISNITGCHNNKCIKVLIDRKEILDKISKGKPWGHGEITALPLKKTTLLKISINSFLEAHKNLLIITLSYFFMLYLFQSLFLFIRNSRLTKVNSTLETTSDKTKQDSIKQSSEYNKLYDNLLCIQELADEYFTHYVHQLITRDICLEEVNLTDTLLRIERLFSYQTIKRNLRITLSHQDTIKPIKSDKEIIFIVLLNLIFKAIYRARISSKILIKISQMQDTINIEISDTGYEYNPKLNSKIQMCHLSEPILEKLCRKVKIYIKETRKNDVNIISAKIINPKIEETKEIHETDDNIIRLRLNPL